MRKEKVSWVGLGYPERTEDGKIKVSVRVPEDQVGQWLHLICPRCLRVTTWRIRRAGEVTVAPSHHKWCPVLQKGAGDGRRLPRRR